MHPYLSAPPPHLFGHRGASGEAPENTLPAFELALRQGVPFLEMDCHATRDGEIVVLHDADLARTTDAAGPVCQLDWEEVRRLDAGYRFTGDGESHAFRGKGVRIPRLAEVLDAFPEARINLEVKQADPPIAERVVEIVRSRASEERVLLASESAAVLDAIRALEPGTAIGASLEDVVAFYRAVADDRIGDFERRGDALQIPPTFMGEPLITPESVAAAHAVGLAIHVWTINDPAQIRELLELGVDGVMSDHPSRLVRVARELESGS